jgi:hypothetical protein
MKSETIMWMITRRMTMELLVTSSMSGEKTGENVWIGAEEGT